MSHRIDGATLPPPLADDLRLLDALDRAGIVRVQLAPGIAAPTADAVGIDDRAAAREMARHLIALGHRRIGFITGDDALAASPLRLEGYRAALDEAGIPVDPAFVAAGDFSYRSGFEAAMRLLGLPDRPTAIFAANDDMAAAVVAAAHRQRLDVPHDVSVCGFDDTAMATMIWPQLTTVRQPIAAIAATATLLLIDALRSKAAGEPRAPHHRLLPFTLVTRESDGPPELSASQPPIAKELPH